MATNPVGEIRDDDVQLIGAIGNATIYVELNDMDAEIKRNEAERERVSAEQKRVEAEAARSVWGDYSDDVTYIPGNKVAYNGSSYLCLAETTAVTPPAEGVWQLIAAKGDPGLDGENGVDGSPGRNGFSPVISVVPIAGGNRVTITDATTTNSFDVLNGADGQDGEDGEDGSGGGKQAYTVVIGTSLSGHSASDCDFLCDGTNDLAQFNDAFASLPSAGGEVHILDGTYTFNDELVIPYGSVVVSGCGPATILLSNVPVERGNGCIILGGCDDVTFRNLTLSCDFSGATSMVKTGTYLFNPNEMTFRLAFVRCVLDGIPGGIVSISWTALPLAELIECRVTGNADSYVGYRLSAPASLRLRASNCEMERGFLLRGGGVVENCHVTINQDSGNFALDAGGSGVVFANNLVDAVCGIQAFTPGSVVTGNKVTCTYIDEYVERNGIRVAGKNNTITGNSVAFEAGVSEMADYDYGIKLEGSAHNVANNTLVGCEIVNNTTTSTVMGNVTIAADGTLMKTGIDEILEALPSAEEVSF